jgi:acyl carrier protein
MSEIIISNELRESVREIVAGVLEVEPTELIDQSSFVDDFDADSLLVIEMYAQFERSLGIKIPQEDVIELDNLPTAYEVVAAHASQKAVHG